jgi:hypothetical protein
MKREIEVAEVSFMSRLKCYAEVDYDRYEHIMKEIQILFLQATGHMAIDGNVYSMQSELIPIGSTEGQSRN